MLLALGLIATLYTTYFKLIFKTSTLFTIGYYCWWFI